MKKMAYFIVGIVSLASSIGNCAEARDLTSDIPVINAPDNNNFSKIANVAQYGDGDWSQVVGISRNISRKEAMTIAEENPEITFFFFTKGYQMVLGNPQSDYRLFRRGDVVFFKGEPWWGSAEGLADGYVKKVSGS